MTAETLASGASTSGRQLAGAKSKQDLAEAGRQKLEAYRNKKKTVNSLASERVFKRESPARVSKRKPKEVFSGSTYGAAEEAWSLGSEGAGEDVVPSITDSRTTDQSSLRDSSTLSSVEFPLPSREQAVQNSIYDNPAPPVLPYVEVERSAQLVSGLCAVDTQQVLMLISPEVKALGLPVMFREGTGRMPSLDELKWRGPDWAQEQSSALSPVHNASSSSLSDSSWWLQSHEQPPQSMPLPADTKDDPVRPPVTPPVLSASLSELFAPGPPAPSSLKQTPFFLSEFPHQQRKKRMSGSSEWQLSNIFNFPSLALSVKPSPAAAFQNSRKSSEVADSITIGAAFDFHTLEQHIDSLTVEKFALQRSMDSAKVLADALVDENRGFMETFNQQGAAMTGLRQELQERLEEVDSLQMVATGALEERDRAVEEAGGATERSQTLAKEVIALEEKVLQLRSSELKLEAALNNARGEAEGNKQSVASLGRERAHAKQQLSGLYDEKRVLQFRLRRLTLGGALNDICGSSLSNGTMPLFLNATTSTHDLEAESQTRAALEDSSSTTPGNGVQQQTFSTSSTPAAATVVLPSPLQQVGREEEGSGQLTENSAASASLERVTAVIAAAITAARGGPFSPGKREKHPDEALTSIERLLDEILLEKQYLLSALAAREAAANELQVSNSELCNRLSLQTQRLELACAQSMWETSARLSSPSTLQTRSLSEKEYTDESDEVAERMLSWLLRLLPGRRGT